MRRLLLMLFATSVCAHPAGAASSAIRCIDRLTDSPYFLTFDVDNKTVVFKSAGGNFLEGPITASAPTRTAFMLRRGNNPPDFELVWDEAEGTLIWIGIPNDSSRATVESKCTSILPPDK